MVNTSPREEERCWPPTTPSGSSIVRVLGIFSMFFKRMITIAITFAGHVFAIWDQVFTLLKFQVFASFLSFPFSP